jgi:hypothetical protein
VVPDFEVTVDTDGVGIAEYVGMTSETRPTPLNSRPSPGAVTTVIVGAYTNLSPISPPSETRPSESNWRVFCVTVYRFSPLSERTMSRGFMIAVLTVQP